MHLFRFLGRLLLITYMGRKMSVHTSPRPQLRPRHHISSSLQRLHWLPIRSRVLYKQCILMYRINCGQAPKYITDVVSTVAATATRSSLRSENTMNYCLPRLRTKFGERAFSYAGPAAWNRLPQNIRASTSLNVFKWKLKTHLFTEAFY